LRANGGALIAVNVIEQRLITDAGVLVANRVVEQRLDTNTHVPHSSGDVKEGILTYCRVLPEANTRRVWAPCFERWRERKPAEPDCENKKAAAGIQAVGESYYGFHFFGFIWLEVALFEAEIDDKLRPNSN